MGCKSIVRLGRGLWSPWDFCWDGHKYVCEDDFAEEESCLVYTFGVGYEATFEKTMAARGCHVYAYDHTVEKFPDTGYSNLHFERIGIGSVNNVSEKGELKTLDTLLRDNGHSETVINYLKVDVEGAELDSMIQWIESGSLSNVLQIGIEFHDVPNNIRRYFTIVQRLYKLGFVVIAWDPNLFEKHREGPFAYFEIVFRRSDLAECTPLKVLIEKEGKIAQGEDYAVYEDGCCSPYIFAAHQ